jgi:hypothetical protein
MIVNAIFPLCSRKIIISLTTNNLEQWIEIVELFVNSTGVLVGSQLFYIEPIFNKFSVHALEPVWRFERITLCIGSLRVNFMLAPLGMPKWVWASMNQYRMFFIQSSTPTPIVHQKNWTWKVLYAKQPTRWPNLRLNQWITLRPLIISFVWSCEGKFLCNVKFVCLWNIYSEDYPHIK